ncbi:threonine synthase [Leuconostocaceae bacterium ESL0958]|nr:threonine synthase [Leuconostocaceae bacterium ESL0958]
MQYVSTRGASERVTAAQAILRGLASDGGLFVPTEWPQLDWSWSALAQMNYQTLAARIFAAFLPDFSQEEIQGVVTAAYGDQWTNQAIVPLHSIGNQHYLELFHGPTLAFKDIALQALPHLVSLAAKKTGSTQDVAILTATSGDTGTAAMAGFADVAGTEITVLYPKAGISDIQRQQMVTERAKNAHVIGVEGNFDQAQRAVKALLGDSAFADVLRQENLRLSSANSINIGRLIPQIVYYFYGYGQLIQQGQVAPGQAINILVPTGNFGNMLAAYYAKQIGLPVANFQVASNENHVLTDFFATGCYDRRRDFVVTNAPAMDILVSSNLERLLYFTADRNPQTVQSAMQDLAATGSYQVDARVKANLADFRASWASQEAVLAQIRTTFETSGYLIDPHTAVAAAGYVAEGRPTLIAATASPYKFPQTVLKALGLPVQTGPAALTALSQATGTAVPTQLANLFEEPVRHQQVVAPNAIGQAVAAAFQHDESKEEKS